MADFGNADEIVSVSLTVRIYCQFTVYIGEVATKFAGRGGMLLRGGW
jgi:hypothetical protein